MPPTQISGSQIARNWLIGASAFILSLTGAGTAFQVLNSGGSGIFQISSTGTASGTNIHAVNRLSTSGSLAWESGATGATLYLSSRLNVAGPASGRTLYVSGTGSSPILATTTGNGFAGIGTASPTADLHIRRGTTDDDGTNTLLRLSQDFTATASTTSPSVRSSSTLFTTSQAQTATLTKPTGLAVGDVMVFSCVVAGGSSFSLSGWTQHLNTFHYAIFSKVADSSDVAASNFTMSWSGFGERGCGLVAFKDAGSVDVFGSATGTANAPSVTTTVNNATLALIGMHYQATFTTAPAGSTSVIANFAGESEGDNYAGLNFATREAATAGPTGTNAFGATRALTATLAITPGSPTLVNGFGSKIVFDLDTNAGSIIEKGSIAVSYADALNAIPKMTLTSGTGILVLTQNRVGIERSSPKATLDVGGTISGSLITQNGAGSNYFTGNVGIGKTSPATKLDVVGTISGALIMQNGAGNNFFRGNLGLGVSPSFKLHVQGSDNAYNFVVQGANTNSQFYIYNDVTNNAIWLGTSGNAEKDFVYYTGATERSRLKRDSGFFGLDTPTPGSRLAVSGSTIIGNNIGSQAAKATLDVKGTMSGSALTVSGLGGAAVNHGLCLKSAAVVGYCSTALNASGECTCN